MHLLLVLLGKDFGGPKHTFRAIALTMTPVVYKVRDKHPNYFILCPKPLIFLGASPDAPYLQSSRHAAKRSQVRGKLEENGQKLMIGIHMYQRGATFVKRKLNPLNFLHLSKWNFTLLLLSQGYESTQDTSF